MNIRFYGVCSSLQPIFLEPLYEGRTRDLTPEELIEAFEHDEIKTCVQGTLKYSHWVLHDIQKGYGEAYWSTVKGTKYLVIEHSRIEHVFQVI